MASRNGTDAAAMMDHSGLRGSYTAFHHYNIGPRRPNEHHLWRMLIVRVRRNYTGIAIWVAIALYFLLFQSMAAHAALGREPRVFGPIHPAVSNDGANIAFSLMGDLWIVPMGGGKARQLTAGDDWDAQSSFSPDGNFLAFVRYRRPSAEVMLINLDTGIVRTVWRSDVASTHFREEPRWANSFPYSMPPVDVAFHPVKGEVFVLQKTLGGEPPNTGGLFTANMFTGATRRITNFGAKNFAISGVDGTPYFVRPDGIDKADLPSAANQDLFLPAPHGGSIQSAAILESGDVIYLTRTFQHQVRLKRRDQTSSTMVAELPHATAEFAVALSGGGAAFAADRRLFAFDLATGQSKEIRIDTATENYVPPQRHTTILNARILDVGSGSLTGPSTVDIDDGRIVRIEAARVNNTHVRDGVNTIDAGGAVLMPGLVDCHCHVTYNTLFDLHDKLISGVTSIRNPGGTNLEVIAFGDAIANGRLSGPRIYSLSPHIRYAEYPDDDLAIASPEEADRLAASVARAGYFGIKLRQGGSSSGLPLNTIALPLDVLDAITAAARKHGLKSLIHPGAISWMQALDAKIDAIAHIGLVDSAFVARTTKTSHLKEREPEKLIPLFQRMAKDGVMLDPGPLATIIYRRRGSSLVDAAARSASWNSVGEVLRLAHQAGVRLTAGTDSDFISLVDEMEAYEQLGVPNLAVIQSATTNCAEWLGQKKEFGTVSIGARADLILVRGNPLEKIAHLRDLVLVMQDGRVVRQ